MTIDTNKSTPENTTLKPDGDSWENETRDRNASGIQKLIVKWEQLTSRPDLDFEERLKRRLFTLLILPGMCVLFSFAVYHLAQGTVIEGLVDLVAGLWLLVTLYAFKVLKNGINIYRLNALIIGGLFLFLTVTGGVYGNKLMWTFSFPLIALYSLGKNEGLAYTAMLYVLIIILLYVPQDVVRVYPYPPEFKIRFCVAYFLVGSLAYIYEAVREKSQVSLKNEGNKLEVEKAKLGELSATLQTVNQALTISEERLKRAQVIARVGNMEYRLATGMLWGSREALQILGIDAPEGQFPLSVLEKVVQDFPAFRQDLEQTMIDHREYDRELTINRLSDGKTVFLHAKAEMALNAAGEDEKVIGVIQDVSDRKDAERKRKELEDKLARSQKMESLGLLAGGVAHDLNNVLSGVVGYPDLLLRTLPSESPMTKPLQKIQESGQKAAAIVQDLLTLARRGVSNHRVLNLNDLITEFLVSPEQKDIQDWHADVAFETHLKPDLLNIKGSPVHLKKTVMNLVSNAAEALPAGGNVCIRTDNRHIEGGGQGYGDLAEGDYILLTVEDNGTGISPDDLGRIFEPFYTKKKMGRSGTGLGMSVVWGTVQDHHGHIRIDSSEGVGTRIEVFLPATREPVAEQERIVPMAAYAGSGENILVVDDVAEQRDLAESMLTGLGYKVHTVDSGEAALAFLADRSVDLVILDMIMDPGIDGLETYTRILASHPGQRAIIVSGFSETDRVRQAQRMGARAYVKKPYTLEKLGIAVRDTLIN